MSELELELVLELVLELELELELELVLELELELVLELELELELVSELVSVSVSELELVSVSELELQEYLVYTHFILSCNQCYMFSLHRLTKYSLWCSMFVLHSHWQEYKFFCWEHKNFLLCEIQDYNS